MYSEATASTGPPADSAEPSRREILLAHIVSTKTTNTLISDNDMALPPDWKNATVRSGVGHIEEGRTVALHSLAVLPSCQRRGLGATLLKAYIQRIESAEIADRIALLSHDTYVPFYERHGFVNKGESNATYGGGGWYNMVCLLLLDSLLSLADSPCLQGP
jgi:N-acetylglutamate synthase-like GNAT family acetyltransferase